MPVGYDQDVMAWAAEQARLIRTGQFDQLDIEHIADEIDDVGKSENTRAGKSHGRPAGPPPEMAVSALAPGHELGAHNA